MTTETIEQLGTKTVSALVAAQGLNITTNEDYQEAGRRREALREIEKQIDETFDHLIDAAHKHHKSLVAEKKRHAAPIEEARAIYKRLMFTWEDKLEAARRTEEARLQAAAKAMAEEEALAVAEQAQAEGDTDAAMAAIANVQAQPVVVPKVLPKVAGHIRRMVPKFRIKNAALLPRKFLIPDEKAIGGVVRSLRGAHGIPGVEYYEEAV